MGVFIDYSYHIECPEEELLERLRRIRSKLVKLPFDRVSRIIHVDPAYQPLPLIVLRENGYKMPAEVSRRLRGKLEADHDHKCRLVVPSGFMNVPKKIQDRFYRPATEFMRTTKLWNEEDLPEEIFVPYCLTYYRIAFILEMTGVMLRHGYAIAVQPCEGCETFTIGLSSYRSEGTPYWLGSGFTKTQYSTRFVEAHESICRALDLIREEGLLLKASDTCNFYKHRDWSKSAEIVNAETTGAMLFRSMFTAGIKEAQESGIQIEDISDPATKNFNLVRVEKDEKKSEQKSEKKKPPRKKRPKSEE